MSLPDPSTFRLVGVLHLPPLPGAPTGGWPLAQVIDRALGDAAALVAGGIDSCIIENLGDAPFVGGRTEPEVAACMAVVADRVRQAHGEGLHLGINVLRNDVASALGIAVACAADFVRVNVHTGAAWTDQGLVTGSAADTLRRRRLIGAEAVKIAADVLVKHAVPAGCDDLSEVARETVGRGHADLIIVSGRATGRPTEPRDVDAAVAAVPGIPVWVGSGVTEASIGGLLGRCHGAIVGTFLHEGSDIRKPLDPRRIERLVAAREAALAGVAACVALPGESGV
jgi:membrane complex biogenesis BtpA family protein